MSYSRTIDRGIIMLKSALIAERKHLIQLKGGVKKHTPGTAFLQIVSVKPV